MATQNDAVPKITIHQTKAFSNAMLPENIADTCASWEPVQARRAKHLLKTVDAITCHDATAFSALTAMAYDMLIHGKEVKAKIVKGWEGAR